MACTSRLKIDELSFLNRRAVEKGRPVQYPSYRTTRIPVRARVRNFVQADGTRANLGFRVRLNTEIGHSSMVKALALNRVDGALHE